MMKLLARCDVPPRAKARFTSLAPRSARGIRGARDLRPRRRPLQNHALRKHVVVAASAATKSGHVRYPAPSAGLRLLRAPSRATVARPALPWPQFLASSQFHVAQTLLSVRSGAAARIAQS